MVRSIGAIHWYSTIANLSQSYWSLIGTLALCRDGVMGMLLAVVEVHNTGVTECDFLALLLTANWIVIRRAGLLLALVQRWRCDAGHR